MINTNIFSVTSVKVMKIQPQNSFQEQFISWYKKEL